MANSSSGAHHAHHGKKANRVRGLIIWSIIYGVTLLLCIMIPILAYPSDPSESIWSFIVSILLAILIVITAVVYASKSLGVYKPNAYGLRLVLGKKKGVIHPGLWHNALGFVEILFFPKNQLQYQFPNDLKGEEKNKKIYVNSNTTFGKKGQTDGSDEHPALQKVVPVIISPAVYFQFGDLEKLYEKFGTFYDQGGWKAVADEIARQINDTIVSETSQIFARKTIEDIFKDIDATNKQLQERVEADTLDWGIENVKVKHTTITLDDIVQQAFNEFLKTKIEADADVVEAEKVARIYEIETGKITTRAKAAGIPAKTLLVYEAVIKAMANGNHVTVNSGNSTEGFMGMLAQQFFGKEMPSNILNAKGAPISDD